MSRICFLIDESFHACNRRLFLDIINNIVLFVKKVITEQLFRNPRLFWGYQLFRHKKPTAPTLFFSVTDSAEGFRRFVLDLTRNACKNFETSNEISNLLSLKRACSSLVNLFDSMGTHSTGLESNRGQNMIFILGACPKGVLDMAHFAGLEGILHKPDQESESNINSITESINEAFNAEGGLRDHFYERCINLHWVDTADISTGLEIDNSEYEGRRVIRELLKGFRGSLFPLQLLSICENILPFSVLFLHCLRGNGNDFYQYCSKKFKDTFFKKLSLTDLCSMEQPRSLFSYIKQSATNFDVRCIEPWFKSLGFGMFLHKNSNTTSSITSQQWQFNDPHGILQYRVDKYRANIADPDALHLKGDIKLRYNIVEKRIFFQ